MSRWVEPKRPDLVGHGDGREASGPAERIVKYIPAEVLVGYTGLITMLGALGVADARRSSLAAFLMGVFFVVTFVLVATRAPKEGRVRRSHLIVSPLAFVAWSYPISACLLQSLFLPALAFVLLATTVAVSLVVAPRAG